MRRPKEDEGPAISGRQQGSTRLGSTAVEAPPHRPGIMLRKANPGMANGAISLPMLGARPGRDSGERKGDCRAMTHLAGFATCRFLVSAKRARTAHQPASRGRLRPSPAKPVGDDASSMRISSGRWDGENRTAPYSRGSLPMRTPSRPSRHSDIRSTNRGALAFSTYANHPRGGRACATTTSADRRPQRPAASNHLWGR
ncbi:hypothetical protein GGC65_001315 [Sphingopyxis sp. OAS728]|nr:hypothetical protein [Sphingopyxis sp. OAS728]